MVSKCANPECNAPFLYFHVGKLFRIESATGYERRRALGSDESTKQPRRHIEFYWLCAKCSETMTLTFEEGVGISVRSQLAGEASRKMPKTKTAAAHVTAA